MQQWAPPDDLKYDTTPWFTEHLLGAWHGSGRGHNSGLCRLAFLEDQQATPASSLHYL